MVRMSMMSIAALAVAAAALGSPAHAQYAAPGYEAAPTPGYVQVQPSRRTSPAYSGTSHTGAYGAKYLAPVEEPAYHAPGLQVPPAFDTTRAPGHDAYAAAPPYATKPAYVAPQRHSYSRKAYGYRSYKTYRSRGRY